MSLLPPSSANFSVSETSLGKHEAAILLDGEISDSDPQEETHYPDVTDYDDSEIDQAAEPKVAVKKKNRRGRKNKGRRKLELAKSLQTQGTDALEEFTVDVADAEIALQTSTESPCAIEQREFINENGKRLRDEDSGQGNEARKQRRKAAKAAKKARIQEGTWPIADLVKEMPKRVRLLHERADRAPVHILDIDVDETKTSNDCTCCPKTGPPIPQVGVQDLRDAGFKEVPDKWDGHTHQVFTDKNGNVVGYLLGSSEGAAASTLESHQQLTKLELSGGPVNGGLAMEEGEEIPKSVTMAHSHGETLEQTIRDKRIARFAGHACRALPLAFPRAFNFLAMISRRLYRRYGTVFRRPFLGSLFPSFTIHCGSGSPAFGESACGTFTTPCPGTPIAITALGTYDPDTCGHLVLPDVGIFIRFPPASTIVLLGSFRYSIVAVPGDGMSRTSITQYFPRTLVNHVKWQFRTKAELSQSRLENIDTADKLQFACLLGRHPEQRPASPT